MDGYSLLSLPVATLPPADSINTVVIGGGRWIVDPGSDEPLPLTARPEGVILTHRHRDHVDGAQAVQQRWGCPIFAHPVTAEELAGRVRVERFLEEGDVLDIGAGRSTRVLHTPGHARGHIVLHEAATGVMVVGDMIAGVGSIVIAAPDGNVRHYLASLRRMRELQPQTLVPAHGPVVGVEKLDEYIAHRLKREAEILAAVQAGGETIEDIVSVVYKDTPAFLLPWATRSAETHLQKLIEDGLVTQQGHSYLRGR